nr:helix-turn-helix domain-containing protein [uncultured Devosia sp.]
MTDDEALQTLMALGDERRFDIFRRLRSVPAQPAGKLADLAPSTITHHLKMMQQAGLVLCERDGRQNRYTMREQTLIDLARWLEEGAQEAILGRASAFTDYPDLVNR